jgi:hypothetical protein
MNQTEIIYEGFNREHMVIATESYDEVTKELISATAEGTPYIEVNEIRDDGVEVRVLINCVNVMSVKEAKPYNLDALRGHKEEEKEDDKAKEGKD